MQRDERFSDLSANFWANVKLLSQHIGYTERSKKSRSSQIKIPSINEIEKAYVELRLDRNALTAMENEKSLLDQLVLYFTFRADVLNNSVSSSLMNKEEANVKFQELFKDYKELKLDCPLPLNKQKGEKSGYALLTCMVNILIAKELKSLNCNYDPHSLSYFMKDSFLVRTLSRRIDGAFPDIINPISVWEIKEYYNTTTFGSRIADAIYETIMDGMELKELYEKTSIKVNHILIVDAYNTWWQMGKSYLCRMIDMLNMGLVSEIIFGKEILTRIPALAKEWAATVDSRK